MFLAGHTLSQRGPVTIIKDIEYQQSHEIQSVTERTQPSSQAQTFELRVRKLKESQMTMAGHTLPQRDPTTIIKSSSHRFRGFVSWF